MRYIIVGAGAVGGTIGARLFEAGHDVVLVARGAHYEALRDRGLTYTGPERTVVLPIPAIDRPEAIELRADDVLVLAMKTQDGQAALDAWADRPVAGGGRASEVLPVLCAQNGVESERLALRRFRRVYGVCVWLPATHLEPGAVAAQGAPVAGVLEIGNYPAGADDTVRLICADLEKSGFSAPVCEDVMPSKYAKLLSNVTNAIQALCGLGEGHSFADPALTEIKDWAVAEALAAYSAAGIVHASDEQVARTRAGFRVVAAGGTARKGGSSWQSLDRGTGSIESDYLNGEIVLLGRLHGVPTPVNAVLQQLANRFARERRPAGSMSPAQLMAEIEAAQSST
jgi:2-dehydropantoate 2-reductase